MSRVAVRRTIPLFLTMIMGIIVLVDFYFGGLPGISQTAPILSKWATIIWGFAMPYAVLTVFIDHAQKIKNRTPGRWYYSVWMLFLIILMVYLGSTGGIGGTMYLEVFQYMAAPVLSTMTGMLGLYCVSAAFRAWHARTTEALTMLAAGFLCVLGLIAPIGEVIWPGFGPLANYFNDWSFKATRTVFYIATSLGAMLLGYRTLMGQETGYLKLEE